MLAALLVAAPLAARQRPSDPHHFLEPAPTVDPFSAARPAEARTRHLSLDITVDFVAKRVQGAAVHQIVVAESASQFLVDTFDLEIERVTVDGIEVQWTLGAKNAGGQALSIPVTRSSNEVRIEYRSGTTARALWWHTASQTRGRAEPFLWSKSQPEDARSWIPVQDTPGVRATWDATVRVPPGLLALMSASNNPIEPNGDGVYRFTMPQSMPAYLIAIAVGRIEHRSLGPRVGVYAEPELIEDAEYEMSFLPELMRAAERLMGPYPYERYDLLFPPGFGSGMEHTQLNFISPDVISGNRPETVETHTVVAHELAHSWAGNLVTCSTWADTWLNEGLATYYEKRLLEEMEGFERAELAYYYDRRNFADYAAMNSVRLQPYRTMLHRPFPGTERGGNAFNTTAYQKGMLFLKMLEDRIGRETFDEFLRSYFRAYALRWTDDRRFLEHLQSEVLDERRGLAAELRIDEWVYGSGLPSNVTAPTSSALLNRIQPEADAFRAGRPVSQLPAHWGQTEIGAFLLLIGNEGIQARFDELDAHFRYSQMKTPPLGFMVIAAKSLHPTWMPAIERFLSLGSNSTIPIWQELFATAPGRAYGLELYPRIREFYPPNVQAHIDSMIRFLRPLATAAAAA